LIEQKQQEIVKAYFRGEISEKRMLKELGKPDHKKTGKNKYLNKKVTVDGIEFDSVKEANYYLYLRQLQKTGEVVKIELQPRFELLPGFAKNGKKYRPINYTADFKVTYADGRVEVIDTKGYKTQVFKLKHKLFEYKYSNLSLKLV
jgi:hypothetical protein